MQTFDITLNLFVFGSMLIVAVLLGYLRRSRQLAKKTRQIAKLEKEMIQAHAELLETQREFCELEAKMKDITNPVIPMNSKSSDDQTQTPLPERDGMRHHRPAGSR
ncbi:MAG TPA: LapA family protein [Puia sp.]|jgi:septal ring factor EnvC (AmiA/AmiB activator)|nr:LapA family protein [Puia sp.]